MSYIIPYIVASVIIGIGVDYFIQIIESRLLRIIICLGIFLISYLVALRLFDRDNLNFLLSLLPRRRNLKNRALQTMSKAFAPTEYISSIILTGIV